MRILGLDLGKASVGWSIIDLDEEKGEGAILAAGARTFPAGEIPKTGESPNLPRRLGRSSRRRLRRVKHRLERLRILFVKEGLLDREEYLSKGKPDLEAFGKLHHSIAKRNMSPYQLRFNALERKLEPIEWVVVLTHCAKRRGFHSNSKRELSSSDDETGKMKQGLESNRKIMEEAQYRTVGEMLWSDPKFKAHKRNKGGSYAHTLARRQVKTEIKTLFESQRKFKNPFAKPDFESAYLAIWSSQRHFDEKKNITKMIGHCTFEPEEHRAPSHSYTAERFMLWQTVNNLRYRDANMRLCSLTDKQRQLAAKLAYESERPSYKSLRKKLNLEEEVRFTGLSYPKNFKEERSNTKKKSETSEKDTSKKNDPEKKVFVQLKAWHSLRKLITADLGAKAWEGLKVQTDLMDTIAEALGHYKSDDKVREHLKEKAPQLKEKIIESILNLSWDKFKHLSLKALGRITPYLEKGLSYDTACQEAGYDFQNKGKTTALSKYLPPIAPEEIRNPVVLRSLSQARKVVNALIREYGSPHCIHIELLREIAHSRKEIDDIQKGQDEFRKNKELAVKRFQELYKREPQKDELLKFRLYEQQNGQCPYSGEMMPAPRLIETGYVQIDHILPFSRSMDDSMRNKVLCLTKKNQDKSNQIPFEYFGGPDSKKWQDFSIRILHQMKALPASRKQRLLRDSFTPEEAAEYSFKQVERAESKWIAKFFKNHLEEKLEFAPSKIKRKVQTRNGALTAFLRHHWGLGHLKKRKENDLHHALDAIIVAAATEGMVQRLSRFSSGCETGDLRAKKNKKGRWKDAFPKPWTNFRTEVEEYITKEKVFVSRPPRCKINGQAHSDTIYSIKDLPSPYKLKRIALEDLSIKMLEDLMDDREALSILDKEGKNKKLYKALLQRIEKHSNNPKKAFAENFYHPEYPDKKIPVRKIKYIDTGRAGPLIRKGISENASMIRTDVFQKDKKYHLVPVYTKHRFEEKLPNKAIVQAKAESEWTEIDESFQFLFSLHLDELVEIQKKTDSKPLVGYFTGTHRSTGSISLVAPDRSTTHRGNGVKTIFSFRKLSVDVLGRVSVIKREKRLELAKPHHKQARRSQAKA